MKRSTRETTKDRSASPNARRSGEHSRSSERHRSRSPGRKFSKYGSPDDKRRRSRSGERRRPAPGSLFGSPGDRNAHRVDVHAQQRWGKDEAEDEKRSAPEKEPEPDFGLSGALAAETNTVNGVVLLHNEPAEARNPTARWRLYVFKAGEPHGEPLHVHRQSRYLFGRERRVADVPTDHPSCSKQHAVLQYRLTEKEGVDGMMHASVRPYVMDLGSTNGTFLNGERLEPQRYYELLEKDMLKFGNSSREFILLKEG